MEGNSEIEALINLVDDEDESIYFQVREKLMSYGTDAVPYLEKAWETKSFGEDFRKRIEVIIHDIQFKDVREGLKKWIEGGGRDLLTGVLLINKHQYPELDVMNIRAQLLDIAAIIKSSFHENMSDMQKISFLNKGLYVHFGFKGDNENYYSPKNSILSDVLERKKGNPLLLSILYIEVGRMLGLNIVGVNLPRHFVVGLKKEKVERYFSPFNRGTLLSVEDLHAYLKKLNLPIEDQFIEECSNLDIIKRVLLNLINSYMKQKNREKQEEVNKLYELFS
ncbi:MAG: hypothetical protein H6599_10780 [Flavobacteriales bacterium]|nr:hypothetical protein [Flavobacteriales bacterium]